MWHFVQNLKCEFYIKQSVDITLYEIANTSHFTVLKQTVGFSDTNDETTGYKIEFDGIAFEIAGMKILDVMEKLM